MAKHPRKKQRLGKSLKDVPEAIRPLGSAVAVLDSTGKDDEERRLESMLFGTTEESFDYATDKILVISGDELDGGLPEGNKELENMLDTDLFFVDDATVPHATTHGLSADLDSAQSDFEHDSDSERDDEDAQAAPRETDEDVRMGSPRPEGDVSQKPEPSGSGLTSRKPPAWADPDDADLQVSLATNNRLRKLRDAVSEDTVGGREYERRLRRQFEKINPTPEWASKARKQLRSSKAKRRRSSVSSASEADEDALPELLSETKGILTVSAKTKIIPQGTLSIERLRDANLSARSEGEIKAVQFHPSPQVPVMLTASADRRLRLFNIDGHTNPHLQTVHIPDLPVTTAQFHPGGTSVLLTGPRPFYYSYDLQTGTAQRSPRGLWGTTFAHANPAGHDGSMEKCSFDSTGSVLAVAGRRGHVHLVDWRAGAGQVVGSVKMNVGVESLWWAGDRLMSLGEDAEVYVWDVGERRCVKRWKDEGGFGSRIMSGDRAGRYVATGSRTGLVNLYGADSPTGDSGRPKLLKTIGNLTTSITSMRFNHDSQLLAIASNTKRDQMRMIHLPSLTAFANWPTSSTPLGHVTSVDFSTGSEYVAIGNNRGRVLLYHLKDFAAQ
ncbi:WD40 repeat-like protein [Obba rivulosa]|uniref:WD40 repeat-like protein n=1 Tax=Obba rivulosa TaxID=1052685 RepID=A0A8E2DQX2_9APHY|nr:WD40 repeat-like protein [Obba rivulosa]